MKSFWKNKKVLVTGGAGFIGSHVVEKLIDRGALVTVLDNLQNGKISNLSSVKGKYTFIKGDALDVKTIEKACSGMSVVMNLAARVGGIEYNKIHQATMMRDNLLVETLVIEAARKAKVERFLIVSSACIYPRNCSVPTPETEGFLDEPEPTNSGYGWAKRMAELLGKFYAEEFGMKVAIVRPYNCYGPRDHFNPETSHVIPALIKRIFDSEDPLIVWGSGKQTRAFLYVEDMAEGMINAVEKLSRPDGINLGTDEEISVKDLVTKIIDISMRSGFLNHRPNVKFDKTKADGSPRRNSDNKKAKRLINFEPRIKLDEGLLRTLKWYIGKNESNKKN